MYVNACTTKIPKIYDRKNVNGCNQFAKIK
jgi:hypothetical protein